MIAQFILDSLIKDRRTNFTGKLAEKIYLMLRKVYLKLRGRTLVHYSLVGSKLKLPISHDLPLNKSQFPEYDMAIGRIPSYLKEKYFNFQAIDIGANIGDTTIIIKHYIDIPILCIEADKYYYLLLKQNTSKLKDVVHENCFVGESSSSQFQFVNYTGSGRLVQNDKSKTKILFSSLNEIVSRHPGFNNVKYLKIDTDGFDCKIIRSNVNFLQKNRPVIFFEYDPYLLNLNGDDGLSIFNILNELGYDKLIIYHNTGEFLISLSVKETTSLKELNLFYSGRKSEIYMDICVFHSDDNDIVEKIRLLELEHFSGLLSTEN